MDANRLKALCERFGLEPVHGKCRRDGRPIGAREKVGGYWAMHLTEDDLLEWERVARPLSEIQAAEIAESEASVRSFHGVVERILKKFGPKDYKLAAVEEEPPF